MGGTYESEGRGNSDVDVSSMSEVRKCECQSKSASKGGLDTGQKGWGHVFVGDRAKPRPGQREHHLRSRLRLRLRLGLGTIEARARPPLHVGKFREEDAARRRGEEDEHGLKPGLRLGLG